MVVLLDEIKLFLGAIVIAKYFFGGIRIMFASTYPGIKYNRLAPLGVLRNSDHIFEFHIWREIPDVFKLQRPYGAYAKMIWSVYNSFGRHFRKDVLLVGAALPAEQRNKAFAIPNGIRLSAADFYKGRNDIGIFDQSVASRSGIDFSWPANDESGVETGVVERPLGMREAGPLLGGGNKNSVIG